MNGSTTRITYAKDRGMAWSTAITWGLIFTMEAMALSVLALVFLPSLWLKLAALLLLVGIPAVVLARRYSPCLLHELNVTRTASR